MLRKLAEFTVKRPKLVLLLVAILLGASVVFGSGVSDKLKVGGYTDPASESSQVEDFLNQEFPTSSNLIVQVIPRSGGLDSPDVSKAVDEVTKLAKAEPDSQVTKTFEDPKETNLRSVDGKSGLILVHVGGNEDEASDRAANIINGLPNDPNVELRAGGDLGVSKEIRAKVKAGIKLSEAVALPVTFVILIVVFGGLVAAFLPIMVGVSSIIMTLLVLTLMTMWTDVSTHALTVATAFGLGLSIDFGLLMVSRFREERDNGKEHHEAIISTVDHAGRTILFSAVTVTLAMVGLLVFPIYFLRSVGLAASAVVLLSALSAIVVLPAFLAILGTKIESLKVIRRKTSPSADSLFWRRVAEAVIKRPVMYALPVIVILVGLGVPFLHAKFATPDQRALPESSTSRQVADSLQNPNEYKMDVSQTITLATRNDAAALKDLALKVSNMDDVIVVQGPIGTFAHGKPAGPVPSIAPDAASQATVFISVETDSARAQQMVRDIRGMIVDHQVEVGGATAELIDSSKSIGDKLPLAIGLIAVSTFILLFLFTGSVIVPLKALVLNVLVLSGVLGIMTWVFQDGHLAHYLGVTPAPLNLSMVVLLCSIAFSLSVDYEIFLLSRIKEARESGLSNDAATVVGLGRVGRIISSAAMLLTITLFSFASGLSFMKMFGIGTALAVVIDATIIRAVVVPAFLKLAGDLNWWAPAPLRWLHSKIGISEAPSDHSTSPPVSDPELARQLSEVGHQQTMVCQRVISPPREVEVVPGRHLVANVNGTVIVVAHMDRAPLTQNSAAAHQLAALVEMVGRTEQKTLAGAFTEMTRQANFSRALVDVGIIMPTATGLEVLISGAVTVVLDDGVLQTILRGRGRLVHQTVPVPAVAVVVTVDEPGQLPFTPAQRNGIYSLTGGSTVPGQGAVIWCSKAPQTPARVPAVQPVIGQPPAAAPLPLVAPVAVQAPAPVVAGPPPRRWIVLDDNSRIEIDQDLLIGRDPDKANATKLGLRPVRIDDVTGEMSRSHMEIRLFNGEVIVTDRNSANGSLVREQGQQGWTKLAPWTSAQWRPGMSVKIGGRTMRLEFTAPHPAQLRPRVDVPHAGPRLQHGGPMYAVAGANFPRV